MMTSAVRIRKSLSPIGLDINPWEIRAVQILGSAGQHLSIRSAVLPRVDALCDDGDITHAGAEALRSMLSRRGFHGHRVVIAAPGSACSAQILALPDRTGGAPIDAIARAEMSRARRDSAGAFALATWYLPERGRGEQGMAVVCEMKSLEDRLDRLESAGFQPVAVDLEESALLRASMSCEVLDADTQTINVLLDVGWDVSLGVITIDGVVVYTRRIGFGVSEMVKKLAERTGIDMHQASRFLTMQASEAEHPGGIGAWAVPGRLRLGKALAQEVDTSVTYVSHAYRKASVGRVIMSGFGSHRPEVRASLDQAVGMPVVGFGSSQDDMGSACPLSIVDEPLRGRIALAYGLAGRFDS
jgi:Tfp pilus assembly PilM family ATPase